MGPGARRAPVAMAVARIARMTEGDQGQPDERAGGRDPAPHVSRGVHGEPPFEARPPGRWRGPRSSAPGPRRGGPGTRCPASSCEPSRDGAVRSRRRCVMPDGPPRISGRGRASASSAARIDPRARCRRDFAVPSGIPSVAGDLRQWQVEVVMKDDDGPLLRLEPAEAAFELVAVGDRPTSASSTDGESIGGELDVDAMAPEPARLIDAGADQQPVEPGVEAIGVAQRGQVTPGPDERRSGRRPWPGRRSRRMSQAAASSREIAAPASSAKAS